MNYKEIDPGQAKELIDGSKDLVLLDVREQHEYDRAHIDGVQLVPLGELPQRQEEIPTDKPILCICAGGVRSEKAARFLLANGYSDVTNMSEGMRGWLTRNLPAVKG